MFTDTVSDSVTQIRNASAAGKETFRVRKSKTVSAVADVLKSNGFISQVADDNYYLAVTLNFETPVNHIKRLSKPGLRRYVKSTEVPKPHSGLGIIIMSTPKGVMTGNQARKQKVGGELICEVW